MIDSNVWWAVGFIEADGCFTIIHSTHGGRFSQYYPRFKVGQRADNSIALYRIQEILGGIGAICGPYSANPLKPNDKPTQMLTIAKKEELVQLVALLDKYPLKTKKASDYAIWRKAVLLWSSTDNSRHSKEPIWLQMREYWEQLKEAHKYRNKV